MAGEVTQPRIGQQQRTSVCAARRASFHSEDGSLRPHHVSASAWSAQLAGGGPAAKETMVDENQGIDRPGGKSQTPEICSRIARL